MDVRGLAACGAVGDPLSDEPVEPVDRQPPPGDATREDDGARVQDIAAVEVHLAGLRVDPRDRPGDEDLGAEPARLLQRTAGELVARHARGEAEVVLDPGRGAGLAARRLPLDDDRVEPFRRPVHSGGEPGRSRADDHRVVVVGRSLRGEPEQLGHPAGLRSGDRLAVHGADDGPLLRGRQWASPLVVGSGSSGVTHLKMTWFRSRKLRSSAHAGSHRSPMTTARGGGGAAADALEAADPVPGESAQLQGDLRCHGCDRVVLVGLEPHDS